MIVEQRSANRRRRQLRIDGCPKADALQEKNDRDAVEGQLMLLDRSAVRANHIDRQGNLMSTIDEKSQLENEDEKVKRHSDTLKSRRRRRRKRSPLECGQIILTWTLVALSIQLFIQSTVLATSENDVVITTETSEQPNLPQLESNNSAESTPKSPNLFQHLPNEVNEPKSSEQLHRELQVTDGYKLLQTARRISIERAKKSIPRRKNELAYEFGSENGTTGAGSKLHETRSSTSARQVNLTQSPYLQSASSNTSTSRTKRDDKQPTNENGSDVAAGSGLLPESSPRRNRRGSLMTNELASSAASAAAGGPLPDVAVSTTPVEKSPADDEEASSDNSIGKRSVDYKVTGAARQQPVASLGQREEESLNGTSAGSSLQLRKTIDLPLDDGRLMAEQSEQAKLMEDSASQYSMVAEESSNSVVQLEILRMRNDTNTSAVASADQQQLLTRSATDRSPGGLIQSGTGQDSPVSPVEDAHPLNEEAELVGAHNFIQFGQVGGQQQDGDSSLAAAGGDSDAAVRLNKSDSIVPAKRNLNATLEAEAKLRDTMNQLHYNKTLAFERNALDTKQVAQSRQVMRPATSLPISRSAFNESRLVPEESSLLPPVSMLDLEEDSARRANLMAVVMNGAEIAKHNEPSEISVSPTRAPSKSVEYLNRKPGLSGSDLLEAADEIHQRQHGSSNRRKAAPNQVGSGGQVGTDWGRRKSVSQQQLLQDSGRQSAEVTNQQPPEPQSNSSYEDIITWTPAAGPAAYRAGSEPVASRPMITLHNDTNTSNLPISYYAASTADNSNQNYSDYTIDYRPLESEVQQQQQQQHQVASKRPSASGDFSSTLANGDYATNEARQTEVVAMHHQVATPGRGQVVRVRGKPRQQQQVAHNRQRRPLQRQQDASENDRHAQDTGYSSASSSANPMINRHQSMRGNNGDDDDGGSQSDGDGDQDDDDTDEEPQAEQEPPASSTRGSANTQSRKWLKSTDGASDMLIPSKSGVSGNDIDETGDSQEEAPKQRQVSAAARERPVRIMAGRYRTRVEQVNRTIPANRDDSEGDYYNSGGSDYAPAPHNGSSIDFAAHWSPTAPPQTKRRPAHVSRPNASRFDTTDLVMGSIPAADYEEVAKGAYPALKSRERLTNSFAPATMKTFRTVDEQPASWDNSDRAVGGQQKRLVEPLGTAGSSSENGYPSQPAGLQIFSNRSSQYNHQVVRAGGFAQPNWRQPPPFQHQQFQGGFSPQTSPPPFGQQHNHFQQASNLQDMSQSGAPYQGASFASNADFARPSSQFKHFSPVLESASYQLEQSQPSSFRQSTLRPHYQALDGDGSRGLPLNQRQAYLGAGYAQQPSGNSSWSIVTYPYPQAASNALSYFSQYHQGRPNQQPLQQPQYLFGGNRPIYGNMAAEAGGGSLAEFANPHQRRPTQQSYYYFEQKPWSHAAEPSSQQSSRATMSSQDPNRANQFAGSSMVQSPVKIKQSLYNMPAPQLIALQKDNQDQTASQPGSGGSTSSLGPERGMRNLQQQQASNLQADKSPSFPEQTDAGQTSNGANNYLTINLKTHTAVGPNQLFWEAAAREAAASAKMETTAAGKVPVTNGHHPPQHRELPSVGANELPMMRRPYSSMRFPLNQQPFGQLAASQTTNGHAYAGRLKSPPQLTTAALMANQLSLNEFAQFQQQAAASTNPHELTYVGPPHSYMIPISLAAASPLDDAEALSFMSAAAAMPASAFAAPSSIDIQETGGDDGMRGAAASSVSPISSANGVSATGSNRPGVSANDNQFLKKGTAVISGHLPLASPATVSDPFGWPMGYGSEAAKSLLKVNHVAPPPSYLIPSKVTAAQTSALLYPTMIDPSKQGSAAPIKEDPSIISSVGPTLPTAHYGDEQQSLDDLWQWNSQMLAQQSMLRPQVWLSPPDNQPTGGSSQRKQANRSPKANHLKVAISTRRPASRRVRLWDRLRMLTQRANKPPGSETQSLSSSSTTGRLDKAKLDQHQQVVTRKSDDDSLRRQKRSIAGIVSSLMKGPQKALSLNESASKTAYRHPLPTRLAIMATGPNDQPTTHNRSELQEMLAFDGSESSNQAIIPLLDHNNMIDSFETDLFAQALLFNQRHMHQQQPVNGDALAVPSGLEESASMRVVSHTPLSQQQQAPATYPTNELQANKQLQSARQVIQDDQFGPVELNGQSSGMLYAAPIYAPIEQEATLEPPANEPGALNLEHLSTRQPAKSRERLKQISMNLIKSSRRPLTRLMKLRTNFVANRLPTTTANSSSSLQLSTGQMDQIGANNLASSSQHHLSIAQQLNHIVSPSVMMSPQVSSLNNFNRFAVPIQQWFQIQQQQQQQNRQRPDEAGEFEGPMQQKLLPLAHYTNNQLAPTGLQPTINVAQRQVSRLAPSSGHLGGTVASFQAQGNRSNGQPAPLNRLLEGNNSYARNTSSDQQISRQFLEAGDGRQYRGQVGLETVSNLFEFRPRLGSQAQRSDRLNPLERAMSELQLYDRHQLGLMPLMRLSVPKGAGDLGALRDDLRHLRFGLMQQKQVADSNGVRRISEYDNYRQNQHQQSGKAMDPASNTMASPQNFTNARNLNPNQQANRYPPSWQWATEPTTSSQSIKSAPYKVPGSISGLRFVSQASLASQAPQPISQAPSVMQINANRSQSARQFQRPAPSNRLNNVPLDGTSNALINGSSNVNLTMPNFSMDAISGGPGGIQGPIAPVHRYTDAEIYSSPSNQQPVEMIGGMRASGDIEAAKLAAAAATAQSSAALMEASSLDDQSFTQLLGHPSPGNTEPGGSGDASTSFGASEPKSAAHSSELTNGEFTMDQQRQFQQQLNQYQMGPQQQQQQQMYSAQQVAGQFPQAGFMIGPNGMMVAGASAIQRPRLPKIIPSINSMANKFRQHLYQTFRLNPLGGRWPNMMSSASFMSPSYPAKQFPMVTPNGYIMMPSNQQQFSPANSGTGEQQADGLIPDNSQYNFVNPASQNTAGSQQYNGESAPIRQQQFLGPMGGQFTREQQQLSSRPSVGQQQLAGSAPAQVELQMNDELSMVAPGTGQPIEQDATLMFGQTAVQQANSGEQTSNELIGAPNVTVQEDQIQPNGLELYEGQDPEMVEQNSYAAHLQEGHHQHLQTNGSTGLEFISHPNNSMGATSNEEITTINLGARGGPRQVMTDVSNNLITSDGTYIQEEQQSANFTEPHRHNKNQPPGRTTTQVGQRNPAHLMRQASISGGGEQPEANITIHHHHVIATEDQPEEQEKEPDQSDQQAAQSGLEQNQQTSSTEGDSNDEARQEPPERYQAGQRATGSRQRGESNSSLLSAHYEPERVVIRGNSSQTNRYTAVTGSGARSKKLLLIGGGNNVTSANQRNKARNVVKTLPTGQYVVRHFHNGNQKQQHQQPVTELVAEQQQDVDYQVIKANPNMVDNGGSGVMMQQRNGTADFPQPNEAISINGVSNPSPNEVGEDQQQQQFVGQQVYEPSEGQSVLFGEQQMGPVEEEQQSEQHQQIQVHEAQNNGNSLELAEQRPSGVNYRRPNQQFSRLNQSATLATAADGSLDDYYDFRPAGQVGLASNYSLSGGGALEPMDAPPSASFEPIVVGSSSSSRQQSSYRQPGERLLNPIQSSRGYRRGNQQQQHLPTADAASSQHEHYVLVDQPVVLTGGGSFNESVYQQAANQSAEQPVVFVNVKPEKVIQPQPRKRPLKLPKRSQMRQRNQQQQHYQLAAQAASNSSQLAFGGEQRASEPTASYHNATTSIVEQPVQNATMPAGLDRQTSGAGGGGQRSPDNIRNHNLKATTASATVLRASGALTRPTKAKIRWQGMSGANGQVSNSSTATGGQNRTRNELASSETNRRDQAWIVSGMTHQAYAATDNTKLLAQMAGNAEVGSLPAANFSTGSPLIEQQLAASNLTAPVVSGESSGHLTTNRPANRSSTRAAGNHRLELQPDQNPMVSASFFVAANGSLEQVGQSSAAESALAAPPSDPRLPGAASDSRTGFESTGNGRVYSHYGLQSAPARPGEGTRLRSPASSTTIPPISRQRPASQAPIAQMHRDSRTAPTSFRLSPSSATSQAPQLPAPQVESSTLPMDVMSNRRSDQQAELVNGTADRQVTDTSSLVGATTTSQTPSVNERPTVFSGVEAAEVVNLGPPKAEEAQQQQQLANASSTFAARSDALESSSPAPEVADLSLASRNSSHRQIDLKGTTAPISGLDLADQYRHHDEAEERLAGPAPIKSQANRPGAMSSRGQVSESSLRIRLNRLLLDTSTSSSATDADQVDVIGGISAAGLQGHSAD